MRALMAAALALATLGGCSDPKLQGRVAALENSNAALAAKIADQEKTITDLSLDVFLLKNDDDMAALSSTDEGYSLAKSDFGPLPVFLEKVEPYLAGFRLTLRIGNPTTATFNGAKLKVRWHSATPKVLAAGAVPSAPKMNEQEVALTQALRPGMYTRAHVILSPATPDDIKNFWVGVDTDQIALRF